MAILWEHINKNQENLMYVQTQLFKKTHALLLIISFLEVQMILIIIMSVWT